MSQASLTVNTFITPDGSPVSNGFILIRLSQDGSASGEQITTQFVSIPLDVNGTIIGSPVFWVNAYISPSGTYYIQSVYSATGQCVSGPNRITV